jgi:hypothetical protein
MPRWTSKATLQGLSTDSFVFGLKSENVSSDPKDPQVLSFALSSLPGLTPAMPLAPRGTVGVSAGLNLQDVVPQQHVARGDDHRFHHEGHAVEHEPAEGNGFAGFLGQAYHDDVGRRPDGGAVAA